VKRRDFLKLTLGTVVASGTPFAPLVYPKTADLDEARAGWPAHSWALAMHLRGEGWVMLANPRLEHKGRLVADSWVATRRATIDRLRLYCGGVAFAEQSPRPMFAHNCSHLDIAPGDTVHLEWTLENMENIE
jgi:hypothetical protein